MQKAYYFHLAFRALVTPAKLHWRLEKTNSAAPVIKTGAAHPWAIGPAQSSSCLSRIIALIRSAKCVTETSERVI